MATKWVTITDKELKTLKEAQSLLRRMAEINTFAEILIQEKTFEKMVKRFSKNQKRITHASAKGKGRNLQQWVCKKLADLLGIEYNQQDDNCDIRSREMGQAGTDVILRGMAVENIPVAIECKSVESLDFLKSINQAKENVKGSYKHWAVVHKRKSLNSPVVIMDWSYYEELLKNTL